jgi:hypothetical protein
MEQKCLSNTGPFWSIMGAVSKVWYKEVQLTRLYSERHYWTRICLWGWTFLLRTAKVVNVQACKVMAMAETGKLDQHGGVICIPTQGETLTQIYRELVLSLCTGNKFPCGAKHSKMTGMTWWTKAVRPSTLISNDKMSCVRHYSLQQTHKYAKLRKNSTSHQKCRKLFMTLLVTGK